MWWPRSRLARPMPHSPRRHIVPSSGLASAAIFALALQVLGCGVLRRVHECDGVVETVNAGLEDLATRVPDAGSSATAYEAIASAYEELEKSIDLLQPNDSALQKAVASYKEVIDHAASNSRSFAAELASPARSRAERKQKAARLERIRTLASSEVSREALALRKINTLCHPQ
jgi:chromosome segregation ATPase